MHKEEKVRWEGDRREREKERERGRKRGRGRARGREGRTTKRPACIRPAFGRTPTSMGAPMHGRRPKLSQARSKWARAHANAHANAHTHTPFAPFAPPQTHIRP
eukprot:848411-Pleurochrysis_carterae.AAC.1